MSGFGWLNEYTGTQLRRNSSSTHITERHGKGEGWGWILGFRKKINKKKEKKKRKKKRHVLVTLWKYIMLHFVQLSLNCSGIGVAEASRELESTGQCAQASLKRRQPFPPAGCAVLVLISVVY